MAVMKPSGTDTIAVRLARMRLTLSAAIQVGEVKKSSYHLRESVLGGNSSSPEPENDNGTTMSDGRIRKMSVSPATSPSRMPPRRDGAKPSNIL